MNRERLDGLIEDALEEAVFTGVAELRYQIEGGQVNLNTYDNSIRRLRDLKKQIFKELDS